MAGAVEDVAATADEDVERRRSDWHVVRFRDRRARVKSCRIVMAVASEFG